MDLSVPPVFAQLYLPPVIGAPLLAAKLVAARLFASFQVGAEIPAGDIFQFAGKEAVADDPIASKFSEVVLSAILICPLVYNEELTNSNKRIVNCLKKASKRKFCFAVVGSVMMKCLR